MLWFQVNVDNCSPFLFSKESLRQLFNEKLPDRLGMKPVTQVFLHFGGKLAYVEFRTPEMATAALDLSGKLWLFGQLLIVGRPNWDVKCQIGVQTRSDQGNVNVSGDEWFCNPKI